MKRKAHPAKRGVVGSFQIHRMADRQGILKSQSRRDTAPVSKPGKVLPDWKDVLAGWKDMPPDEEDHAK